MQLVGCPVEHIGMLEQKHSLVEEGKSVRTGVIQWPATGSWAVAVSTLPHASLPNRGGGSRPGVTHHHTEPCIARPKVEKRKAGRHTRIQRRVQTRSCPAGQSVVSTGVTQWPDWFLDVVEALYSGCAVCLCLMHLLPTAHVRLACRKAQVLAAAGGVVWVCTRCIVRVRCTKTCFGVCACVTM